ncbi:MAG: hypothetical protein K8T26_14645 [Lentisphaerae bacterium]|nr:hypothetical protein [Lentisphaerota bacterium]
MKRMGMGLAMLGLLLALHAPAEDATVVQSFVKVTLTEGLKRYAAATGMRVERVIGTEATLMLPAGVDTAPADLAASISKELAKHNLGLIPIGEKRVVATWLDTTRAPTNTLRSPNLSELLDLPPLAPPAPAVSK